MSSPESPAGHRVAPRGRFAFAEFELNLDRGSLQRDGEEIPLRPKSFAMLQYLVEHAGQLVTREELMSAVWPDVVVGDDSVSQCLIDLRRALGDDERTMIRTVQGRGLILDLPVSRVDDHSDPNSGVSAPARRYRLVLLGLALAAAAGISWWWIEGRLPAGVTEPQPAEGSVAVLPFVDMSPDGDHEYFADGISEEILNHLAHSPDLTVIARTSSFAFKGLNEDVRSIAAKLNVAYLLEGSVRTHGNAIRVTAQLVSAEDGRRLWSRTYDGTLDDIFAVQTNIAGDVADSLHASLGQSGSISGIDPHAYASYLEGRFFYNRRAEGDRIRAQQRFEEALSVSPQFAEAWASLAGTLNARLMDSTEPDLSEAVRAEIIAAQGNAVEQALRFGAELPEVQHRAAQYYFFTGEKRRALTHLEAAHAIEPDHWLVRSAMANELRKLGRLEEAISITKQDIRRDPLNFVLRANLVNQLMWAQRFIEAQAELDRLFEMDAGGPQRGGLQGVLQARLQVLRGEFDAAAESARLLTGSVERSQLQALAYHGLGRDSDSDKALEELISLSAYSWAPLFLAEVYALRGENEEALSWLRVIDFEADCRDENLALSLYYSPFLARLEGDSAWDRIRGDVFGNIKACLIGIEVRPA